MNDRNERFSKIRSLLGFPLEQNPNPHQILNQMLMWEQNLLNRLSNTNAPWNLVLFTLETVAGQSNYPIAQPISAAQESGKVYFVVRSTENEKSPYLPIEFEDFDRQIYENTKFYDNLNGGESNNPIRERISFYRSDAQNQTRVGVITPTPETVQTYNIWFHVGSVDRLEAALNKSGSATEMTDYIDISAAMSLLPSAQWEGLSRAENMDERKSYATALAFQLSRVEPIIDEYIQNLNSPQSFDLDGWNC